MRLRLAAAVSVAAMLRAPAFLAAIAFAPCTQAQLPVSVPAPTAAAAPAPAPAETPDITLLTFGPGTIYWERFGHNAILVGDGPEALAYNYGIFDFNQKNFFLNFVRGYMSYRMAADPLYMDLRMYAWEGRSVTAQHLDLTPAQRIALRDDLQWNALPENTRYRYDYFTSNCSTKVRDALDKVLGGALRKQLEATPTATSYRYEAVRLISPDLWLGMAMDIALGPRADRPINLWQQSFVPMVFEDAVRHVTVTDADGHSHPLVDRERVVLPAHVPDAPVAPPDLRLPLGLGGLAFAALLLFCSTRREHRAARITAAALACSFALLCGVGGLILAAIWGLTQHWAGWCNQDLLVFDPLCLGLLPGWWRLARTSERSGRGTERLSAVVAGLAALALLIKLVPGIDAQANLPWILLLLPSHLVLAISARQRAAAGISQ